MNYLNILVNLYLIVFVSPIIYRVITGLCRYVKWHYSTLKDSKQTEAQEAYNKMVWQKERAYQQKMNEEEILRQAHINYETLRRGFAENMFQQQAFENAFYQKYHQTPPHVSPQSNWCKELGVNPGSSRATVKAAYQRLRSAEHPDRGGDPEKFIAIQKAWDGLKAQIH